MANKKLKERKKEKYTLRLTSTAIILLSAGLFFTLVWIFSLGIIVGSGILPEYLDIFSARKKKNIDQEKPIQNKEVLPIEEKELTFYKQLTHKKEMAIEKSLSESVLNDKDEEKKKDQKKISTKTKIERLRKNIHNYNIQVAALEDEKTSKNLVKRLIKSGYPAYYFQTLIKGKIYYRIRCGPFSTIQETRKYAKLLSNKEGFKPFIIYPGRVD